MKNRKLKAKTKVNNLKRKNRVKVKYSFLTLVLLICLAQIGFGAFMNITKSINYSSKINKMKKLKTEAQEKNSKLKSELLDVNSSKSFEAIARNNLKMAGDDEVLVIINRKKEKEVPKQKTFLKKRKAQ